VRNTYVRITFVRYVRCCYGNDDDVRWAYVEACSYQLSVHMHCKYYFFDNVSMLTFFDVCTYVVNVCIAQVLPIYMFTCTH
jgi:hypothetical protein